VGPRAGLDLCEKSHPHRDSIPVAIPTELPSPTLQSIRKRFLVPRNVLDIFFTPFMLLKLPDVSLKIFFQMRINSFADCVACGFKRRMGQLFWLNLKDIQILST
jgi:hypothetical protein